MKRTTIQIDNPDNSTNKLSVFEAIEESTPIILIFPAMGVMASYYQYLAEAFAKEGYTAITADLRGNGQSSIRPSRKVNFGYEELINMDYVTIIRAIKKRFSNRKICLLGHSLGGQMGCLYASKYQNQLDGLILIACCSVYYKGWTGFSKIRTWIGVQFLNLVASVMGYLPGKQIGFGGLEAKGVIADWSRQSRTGNYELDADAFNYERAMATTTIPILAISFEKDKLAPPKAVNHLLEKFSIAPKEHIHLSSNDLLDDNFNHFNWARKPKNIVGIVKNWLEK